LFLKFFFPVPPTVQRVLLVWSELDIKAWREGDRVVPLTAEAYCAVRQLTGADILDARICIGQSQKVDATATELLNTLHETLKSSPLPWLEAYANVIFATKAFQLITWLALIRSLRDRFNPVRLEISPPQVFSSQFWSDEMFIYRLARQSFDLARRVLEREGVLFNTRAVEIPLRPWRKQPVVRRAIAKTVSYAMNLGFANLFGVNGSAEGMPCLHKDVDVVLVGQQYGDAFHSAPLAAHLAKKFGKRFLWISMRPQPAPNMTSEEIALIENLNFEELRFVDSASLLAGAEKNHRKSLLLDFGSAWHVAGLLAAQTKLGVNQDDWFDFLMDPDLKGFASRYQVWNRIMARLRPKVVVGLSVLQDMALIRAWTRHNDVPFVCFMHGAFYALKYSHDIDADYIGVFGRTLADQLKNSNLPQPRQVVLCGAMQFGEKTASSVRKHEGEESQSSNTVLFLGIFDSLPFFPWSPADTWRMLRDVHKVCCELGKKLRVRPHPRYPASCWSPYVDELNRENPGTISLSSEPSIARDVGRAEFVVASGFDGAVLDTLLAGKLVVSYLPEGLEHIDYSRLLESTGALARGVSELRTLFIAIGKNSTRTDELRHKQGQFLRHYVEGLEDEPWEGALSLIDDVLREGYSTPVMADELVSISD
jgi:hypothetical protein